MSYLKAEAKLNYRTAPGKQQAQGELWARRSPGARLFAAKQLTGAQLPSSPPPLKRPDQDRAAL